MKLKYITFLKYLAFSFLGLLIGTAISTFITRVMYPADFGSWDQYLAYFLSGIIMSPFTMTLGFIAAYEFYMTYAIVATLGFFVFSASTFYNFKTKELKYCLGCLFGMASWSIGNVFVLGAMMSV